MIAALFSFLWIGLGFLGNPASPASMQYQRTGDAVHPNSGVDLFTERTRVQEDANTRTVHSKYYKSNQLFASKTMVWDTQNTLPSYTFKNQHTGEKEVIKPTKEGVLVGYQNGNSTWKEKILPKKDNYAYDEGLVEAVKNNWSALRSGESLSLAIIVPSRLDYYNFSVTVTEQQKNLITVVIAPENFWLRQLVSPITMEFNAEKKLTYISGVTNVNYSDSGTQPVQISYTGKRIS